MEFFIWYITISAAFFSIWFLEAAYGNTLRQHIKRSRFTKDLKHEHALHANKYLPLINIVKSANSNEQFIKVGSKFLRVSKNTASFPWSLSDVPHNIPYEADTYKFILYAEANDIQHNYTNVSTIKGNN